MAKVLEVWAENAQFIGRPIASFPSFKEALAAPLPDGFSRWGVKVTTRKGRDEVRPHITGHLWAMYGEEDGAPGEILRGWDADLRVLMRVANAF